MERLVEGFFFHMVVNSPESKNTHSASQSPKWRILWGPEQLKTGKEKKSNKKATNLPRPSEIFKSVAQAHATQREFRLQPTWAQARLRYGKSKRLLWCEYILKQVISPFLKKNPV